MSMIFLSHCVVAHKLCVDKIREWEGKDEADRDTTGEREDAI